MSNTSYNINNNVHPKKITWEIIKNQKYTENNLSQISYLYVIKACDKEVYTSNNQEPSCNIIIKISISIENILLNKLLDIEILQGITFHKFISKKRNNLLRLQDLSKFFKTSFNLKLPKDIEESFTVEYKKATQLLNSSINI